MTQWWCAATGEPWTWNWQWYPGVHAALLIFASAWLLVGRRNRWAHRPWVWFAVAWFGLLVTLDWPIGKLGAGYLASVHTLQFLLLTLLVAPALIKCIPREGWARIAESRVSGPFRFLAGALPGLVLYNVIVVTTHFPAVVDRAMGTQLGSFLIDSSWLVAGLLLWWPILSPPPFNRLGMFGKMGFLFGATIVPTIPAMMMVFASWPLYELYELSPRVWTHFSPNEDLQLAGLVMKLFGDLPLWIATAVVFFRESAKARDVATS